MKKLLALCLALAICSYGLTAFAGDIVVDNNTNGSGGYINGEVEDTLTDDEIALSPLYFNDFENCTFDATDAYFSVTDTGDTAYGKAFRASYIDIDNFEGWASVEGGVKGSTYLRNEETYSTFNEDLTPGKDYILAFDYKTTDMGNFYPGASGAISFAPQIPNSVFNNGSDYRYFLPLSHDWKQHTVMFNSSTATSMNVNINTIGSNVTTWIDNYGVYEPVKLTVKGLDVKLNITEGVYVDGYLGKGSALVATAPDGMSIKSAKMGGKELDLIDGKLNIDEVTGRVEVNVITNLTALKEKFTIKNNYIWVPKGQSVAQFVNVALKNETYTLTDAEGNERPSNGIIYPGDVLTVKIDDTESKVFGFKYILDTSGTDSYVVSDVVYIVDCLLGRKEPQLPEDDINGSGTLTVSDLVLVRYHILTANGSYSIDE